MLALAPMLDEPPQFSASDVARCRALVAEIDTLAKQSGGYELQRSWVNDSGAGPVFDPERPFCAEDVTPQFLVEIPCYAGIFTGSSPEGTALNIAGRSLWRLMRPLSPQLGAKFIDRWWHRLTQPSPYRGAPHFIREVLSDALALQLPTALRASLPTASHDRMALVERLSALDRARVLPSLATGHATIMEIGAGYGALALALKLALPRATYCVVDLPDSLKLSGCFLATRQDAPVMLVTSAAIRLGKAAILLCAATAIDLLEGLSIDLAINTLSFSEMAPAEVDRYAAFLHRNLAPGGILFEQNMDNTHLGGENFCDPHAILTRYFSGQRSVPGRFTKGTPRIWSRVS
jgi:hypothetical protein